MAELKIDFKKMYDRLKNNKDIEIDISSYSYEAIIEYLIRQRYTLCDELAVQRQRDTKPQEFKAYFDYCEQCKSKAKNIKGMRNNG